MLYVDVNVIEFLINSYSTMYSERWCVRKRNELRSIFHNSIEWCKLCLMNDTRMLKATFILMFLLGIISSVLISFISQYYMTCKDVKSTKVKVFSPLPFEHSQLDISLENIEVSVRRADMEPSGKIYNKSYIKCMQTVYKYKDV